MGLKFHVPEFLNVVQILKNLHEENQSFARKALYADAIRLSGRQWSGNSKLAAINEFNQAIAMGITEAEMVDVRKRLDGPKYL